ncbi:MAG: 16S rRNA (adenine(1518)-N(6)/adenine(1519)-N(6))-dimethyltransferase RsmA [Bdellovibrionia bacterium]
MPAFGKRRALGQHFLRDKSIATLIAQTAVQGAHERGSVALLEIGPGKGAITDLLLDELKAKSPHLPMLLSERDRELAAQWRVRAHMEKDLEVAEGDFLELPESTWLARTPLAVASNLPYSAGTAIVVRLAEHPDKITIMVLMFQAEVAQRLRAEPGTKSWGSLSIWIQNQWEVRKLCAVPPGAFAPPPDVDSEVVVLTPRANPYVAVGKGERERKLWDSLLKTSFAHRRKMLRSSLPEPFRNALERSGLDGTKRAEALNWDEWSRFYQALLSVTS